MSLSLAEFTPGVVYDIKVDNDPANTRQIAGVDYQLACDLLGSKTADGWDFNLVGNGEIDPLSDVIEYFDLIGGQAKLVNATIDPDSKCRLHAEAAVSDPDDWDWAKINIRGGGLEGYACLGIKHDTQEAMVVSLGDMKS